MLPMPTSFNCTVFLADKQRPRDRRNHSYGNMRDPGKLILLNGTLCSGKTAIAIALQSLLAEPYLTVRIEHFLSQPPAGGDPDVAAVLDVQQAANLHHTILALTSAGHNVIAEHTLLDPTWLQDCATQLEGLTPLFVAVRCPLAIAEQRAASVGCRQVKQVRGQFARVHAHGVYDLEVDTSVLSPEECAAQIRRRLQTGPAPQALTLLHAKNVQAQDFAALDFPPRYEGY